VADGRSGYDYKTRLQEQVQIRLRQSPKYRVLSETGPAHERIFEVEVAIGDDLSARATGRSKKEAEQAAARKAAQMISDLDKGKSAD
jgi:ribonuclease-3